MKSSSDSIQLMMAGIFNQTIDIKVFQLEELCVDGFCLIIDGFARRNNTLCFIGFQQRADMMQ